MRERKLGAYYTTNVFVAVFVMDNATICLFTATKCYTLFWSKLVPDHIIIIINTFIKTYATHCIKHDKMSQVLALIYFAC